MTRRNHGIHMKVGACMAASPHCIGADQPLALASSRMAKYGVRHLPVLDGGQIVGLISERDIALVQAVVPDALETSAVEEAMSGVPYCVEADTPLREVASHMATRRIGSAIVTEGGRIVGVFTTTDALAALCRMLDDDAPDASAA